MFDTRNHEEQPPRSLLALARDADAPSPASRPSPPPREPARPSPLLVALEEARRRVPASPSPAPHSHSITESPDAAALPAAEAVARGGKPTAWRRFRTWADGFRAALPGSGSKTRTAAPAEEGQPPAPDRVAPAAKAVPAPPPARAAQLDAVPDERYWTPAIDPFAVIGTIFRAKRLILGTALLGAALGVAVAISTPKKYLSSTEVLIDPRNLKLTDRELTEGGLPSDATLAIVENQTRVLTSGNVLGKVVDRLNLENDPEFNGAREGLGLSGVVAELRSRLSGGSDGSVDAAVRRRSLALQHLHESIAVERGGKTFVIWIGVTTESPAKSALIANTMTDVFLQTYGELQSETAGRAATELNARLEELRNGLERAERGVETFKRRNGIVDAQGKLITDEEILKLNDQLSIARARTLELDARAASARGVGVDDVMSGALPEGIVSNIVTELRSQYATLKAQSDLLSVRLGPRHPQLLAVGAQLAGLREQLSAELRRAVASIGIEQKRAAQLQSELSARLTELKSRQGDLSGQLVTLRELEREATTKRSVYEAFLLRAREAGESQGINTANMSVISTAYPPLESTGPSRAAISLSGLLLGLLAGVGIAGTFGAVRSLRANTLLRERRAAAPAAAPAGQPGLDEISASLRDLHARVRRVADERA